MSKLRYFRKHFKISFIPELRTGLWIQIGNAALAVPFQFIDIVCAVKCIPAGADKHRMYHFCIEINHAVAAFFRPRGFFGGVVPSICCREACSASIILITLLSCSAGV